MPRYKDSQGYIVVKRPDVTTNKRGYVMEHRAIWIDRYGKIPDDAVIHHKNGIKDDNRIENLELYYSNGDHRRVCHGDPVLLADAAARQMKPFDLVDMMFIHAHLPLDRLVTANYAARLY